MAKAARERLARLLGGEEAGAFSGQVSLPADVLRLEVEGVGPIRLPVKPAQAKKLCAVASPAKFGHRDETILDPAVRDTREISPDLVSLDLLSVRSVILSTRPGADQPGRVPCQNSAQGSDLLVYARRAC